MVKSTASFAVFGLLSCVAAIAQDLSPISFLQRADVNSAIIDGTSPQNIVGRDRRAKPTANELSAAGSDLPTAADEGAGGPGVRDIAQGIAFALVPRAVHVGFSTSLRLEYNSNITAGNGGSGQFGSGSAFGVNNSTGVAATGVADDFIITSLLNTTMTWQSSGGSSLGLALGVGYRLYLEHSDFSGLILNTNAPGGLALRFATGEVNWTLYDHVSYDNDPTGSPELSGVSNYSTFTNSFGLEGAWSPAEHWLIRGGYEHTYLSTESDQQSTKRNSDALQLAAIYNVTPLIQTGLTGLVTLSQETSEIGTGFGSVNQSSSSGDSKSTAFSIGPFVRGQITNATNVSLAAGVQTITFDGQNSDSGGGSGDGFSYYGSLRITNNLTEFYSHTLEIGRDTQLGIVSNSVTLDYIRYSALWHITHNVALNGRLFAEKGTQSGGQFGNDKFLQYGGELTFNVPIRPTVAAQLGWRHTTKNSDQAQFNYSVEQIFLSLSWIF